MSNEIKKGDTVRVSGNAPRMYIGGGQRLFVEYDSKVCEVEDGNASIWFDNDKVFTMLVIPTKYLIKVDGETNEESEMDAEIQLHKAFQQFIADSIAASKKYREEYVRFMKDYVSGDIYTQADFLKDFDPTEHEVNPKHHYIPKIMFNTKFWVRYEADLAKEIALECVRDSNYSAEQVAEYAVKTAKEIVKQLRVEQ